MKTILLLLCIFLCSCSKDACEKCTRVWKYKSYTLLSTGAQTDIVNYEGGEESFTACGEDMIEAEEKGRTSYAKVPVPNYTNKWTVVEGTGTCECN